MNEESEGTILGAIAGHVLGRAVTSKGEVKELEDLSPQDIAKRRYAMGKIDSETFNKMKEKLKWYL